MSEKFFDTRMNRRTLLAGLLGTGATMGTLKVVEFMGDTPDKGGHQDAECDPIEVSPVKIYTNNGNFAGMAMNEFYDPQAARECFDDEE